MVELSPDQFRALLDLVYAGEWIINTNREEDPIKKYVSLESYLFSKCRDYGMEHLSEEIDGEFCPSAEFAEGSVSEYLEEYNDQAALQVLAEKLAYRDAPEGLSEDELNDFLDMRFDQYMAEFTDNGLANVTVSL